MNTPFAGRPYFVRLSVDVDPAGNPVSRHATLFVHGEDKGVVHLSFPGPFDTRSEAFASLEATFLDHFGVQLGLF